MKHDNEAIENEELYIEELGEVRGGSDLRDSLLAKGNATTFARGEEGPNPFQPHYDPERPALELPWLRATQRSVPGSDH
ncbi:MAG: hypothetical protein ABW217_15305 [Polyangiaceae bacterium]